MPGLLVLSGHSRSLLPTIPGHSYRPVRPNNCWLRTMLVSHTFPSLIDDILLPAYWSPRTTFWTHFQKPITPVADRRKLASRDYRQRILRFLKPERNLPGLRTNGFGCDVGFMVKASCRHAPDGVMGAAWLPAAGRNEGKIPSQKGDSQCPTLRIPSVWRDGTRLRPIATPSRRSASTSLQGLRELFSI